MTREIPLTKGYAAIVDDEDYDMLSKYSWRFQSGYAVRTTSRKEGARKSVLMHREITPTDEGYQIDHINGNKLDNRKCNLRIVTARENAHNAPMRRRNQSGYKGVSYDKRRSRWRSRLRTQGTYVWIGYFATSTEAARAYNAKARELFGEYARLNVIPEDSAV